MAILLIYLLGALSISFLCSILEAVLMSTPLSFITMREDEGYRSATRFKNYKTDNARPIAAILSLNTISHTIGAAGVGAQATLLFGSQWFGLVSAITTILILIFSEILPKTIGTSQWKHLMGFTAKTIQILIIILFPIVWVVDKFSKSLTPIEEEEAAVSREEVAAMADIAEDEKVIDEDENKIIQNVIRLGNVKAEEVMTPSAVASIAPESMTLREFYQNKEFAHFSRIPVYSDSDQYLTGYVLRDDALENMAEDKFDKTLGEIKRHLELYDEGRPVDQIWDSLIRSKDQIAGIIDEYGCFQGILTLEDIIETILGLEIIDERDDHPDMRQYAKERWNQRQSKYKEIPLQKQLPTP